MYFFIRINLVDVQNQNLPNMNFKTMERPMAPNFDQGHFNPFIGFLVIENNEFHNPPPKKKYRVKM